MNTLTEPTDFVVTLEQTDSGYEKKDYNVKILSYSIVVHTTRHTATNYCPACIMDKLHASVLYIILCVNHRQLYCGTSVYKVYCTTAVHISTVENWSL